MVTISRPVKSGLAMDLLRSLCLSLAVLCAFLGVTAEAQVRATGASFSDDRPEGATRFVLELTGDADPRVFVVDQPARLVVDFDDVVFDVQPPVEPEGLVSDWRFGPLRPGTSRIVLDLAEPALVASKHSVPAEDGRSGRLVLDLAPVDAARFRTAARTAVADLSAPLPPAPAGHEPVVVIDPGHGGIDPGAVSKDDVFEKDLTLAFAERLAADLEAIGGLTVRLTRGDDRFLSLARRIKVARAYGADLFISVHADSAPQDYVQGATVYTLSERASDAQAAALAARENLADSVSGLVEPDLQEDVSGILADLMRKETKTFSHEFAGILIGSMAKSVRLNVNPHRSARFRVLMAHDFPSVLLELGYLTNSDDAKLLIAPDWQARASDAVADAVRAFFALPPSGAQTARREGAAGKPQSGLMSEHDG